MMLCCATTIFAQNNKISYQAVVRDTENKLVANKDVQVTVNIYNGDATTAAYTETQTATTNLNGLVSLLIGNGTVTDGNWGLIDWKTARIETTVTLAGTSLGTLAMPLTAVPYAMYAEYADELDPDAAVVIGIYNKILYDSLALGALIDANAAKIGELQEMDEALSARIAADSNNLVIFKAKMKTDSTTLRNLINTNAANIGELQEMDEALSARITADSNNLVIFKAKMKTDSTTLRNLINTNAANIGELQEMDETLSARIAADSNNLVIFKAKVKTDSTTLRNQINTNAENITITNTNLTALQNRVNTFNTNVCDSVDACVKRIVSDTASALRGLIENTDDKFDNYYTKTQTDINIHDTANTVREEMSAQLATKADADNVYSKADMDQKLGAKADTNNVYTKDLVYTKAEVDALLAQLVLSLPKMDQETFTVANDGQTTFTLNHAPKSDYIYRMYINGVMVGGSNTQVLTISSTATKTMQYDASKNGNKTLKANDKVTIVYWY